MLKRMFAQLSNWPAWHSVGNFNLFLITSLWSFIFANYRLLSSTGRVWSLLARRNLISRGPEKLIRLPALLQTATAQHFTTPGALCVALKTGRNEEKYRARERQWDGQKKDTGMVYITYRSCFYSSQETNLVTVGLRIKFSTGQRCENSLSLLRN